MIVRYDNEDKLVVQHKGLINGRFDFTTLNELRIFIYMLLQINKDDKSFRMVKIPCAHLHGKKKRVHYDDIKAATKTLVKKTIEVESRDKNGKRVYEAIPLMAISRYTDGEGYLYAKFNDEAAPYLLGLKENFAASKYRFWASIKSVYSYRVYWLLKQYDDWGKFSVEVEHFRQMLVLEKKYEKYPDLRKRVIIPIQKDLKHTDMAFTYEEDKAGSRSVKKLTFYFNNKQERQAKSLASTKPSAQSAQRTIDFQEDESFAKPGKEKDTVASKLATFGLSSQEIGYYRMKLPAHLMGKTVYILDVKWSGSNLTKDEIYREVKQCLDDKITANVNTIPIFEDVTVVRESSAK